SAHHIDRRPDLPGFVVDLVDRAASVWRFEPLLVDGEPVPARARMNLRVVARPAGDNYEVSIANGSFGEYSDTATDHVTRRQDRFKPPRYPEEMPRRGAAGTVYRLAKGCREGSGEAAIAERVNLRGDGRGPGREARRRAVAQRAGKSAP